MSPASRSEEHKRGYYGVVLVVGVGLSVAGNALHAGAVTDGSTLAAVGAAIFPVLLLMMTELTMLTAKRFAGWVRGVTAGLAAVVAVISFAISYEALAYAARELFRIGSFLSWLAPLTVDLPIIAATLSLWAASDLIRRDRADDGRVVDEESDPASAVVDPRVAGSASGGSPVDAVDRPVVDQLPEGHRPAVVGLPATEPPQVGEVAAAGVDQSVTHATVTGQPADQPRVVADSSVDADPVAVDGAPAQPATGLVDRLVGQPAALVADSPVVGIDEVAAAVHADSNTAKPVEVVSEVLRLAGLGESQRAIAATVGVDRSLVRKWMVAAEKHRDAEPLAVS